MKREELNTLLTEWEQFKKANWYHSDAIDVEKYLMEKFAEIKALPLPPAEGAEEIFRECFAEEAAKRGDTPLSDEKWNDLVKESGGFMFRAMERFATLHAQRLAEKMVSERCKNCKYRGLPDSINEALNSGDGVYRP